jgi:D-aminoacyl-tRNA deacylase
MIIQRVGLAIEKQSARIDAKMRIVLQRVARASVTVEGKMVGAIERGLLLLLGVHGSDTRECADFLASKCAELRIFPDAEGKMNLCAKEIGAAALVVSQFTLYGDCSKGRRPNFMAAAAPEKATEWYEYFCGALRSHLPRVETGVFGSMMQVELVNDGPVTLVLEKRAGE